MQTSPAFSQANIDDLLKADRCELRSSIRDFAQSVVQASLEKVIVSFRASSGWVLLSDVHTGEVLAYGELLRSSRVNEVRTSSAGERLPEFKSLLFAMGLETGTFALTDTIDLRKVKTLRSSEDFPFGRQISLLEAFTFPSVTGIKIYLRRQREKFESVFLERINEARERLKEHDFPGKGAPLSRINPINVGYGLSISPMDLLALNAATLNDGQLLPLSFHQMKAECSNFRPYSLIQITTSVEIRSLLRRNVEVGAAKKAKTTSVAVGGESGITRGDGGRPVNFFVGAFPIEKPEYQLFVALEAPQAVSESFGFLTPSWNVVPFAGKLIGELSPRLLKVVPADREGPIR